MNSDNTENFYTNNGSNQESLTSNIGRKKDLISHKRLQIMCLQTFGFYKSIRISFAQVPLPKMSCETFTQC